MVGECVKSNAFSIHIDSEKLSPRLYQFASVELCRGVVGPRQTLTIEVFAVGHISVT